jgi:hypothetical protein
MIAPTRPYRVTLDTNCLLDLEDNTHRGTAVRDLICRHDSGLITLSIPAIMASERQRDGVYLSNFTEFTDRLSKLGVGHLPLLLPMGYNDVSFWDYGLWVDNNAMIDLECQIHEILHPEVEYEYTRYCQKLGIDPNTEPFERRWRNAKCDVQVAWSHIYHKGDLLVTNDDNFLKKSKLPRLIALGAKAIVRTQEAPNFLNSVA